MYQYQNIAKGVIQGYAQLFCKLYLHISRVIFEEPPLTIHGVCVATSIAGVDRQFFKIKLLRYFEYLRSIKVKHLFP